MVLSPHDVAPMPIVQHEEPRWHLPWAEHSSWQIPLLLFLGMLALYWATPTAANTFDAVAYANQISQAYFTGSPKTLFHPHHLLFNAVGYLLWRGAHALGYIGGPLMVVQRLNAVLGAAGVVVLFGLLRRRHSAATALWWSAGVGVSFGWWICATDGRVNMPSILLLTAAFAALGRFVERPALGGAALTGLLAGLAVLFHQSAGLFVLVGVAGIRLAAGPAARWRALAAYGGAWGATVVLPYLLVAGLGLHLHSPGAFRHWVSTYAEQGQWWDFRLGTDLRRDLFALGHTIVAQAPGRAAGPLCASVAFGLLAALAGRVPGPARHSPLTAACLTWIGLYTAFFTVWCPGYFVFWVPLLVPISVLLARPLPTRLGAGLVALGGLINLTLGVAPYMSPRGSPDRQAAALVRAHTQRHDLILIAGVRRDAQAEVDIPYFAARNCLSLRSVLRHAATPTAAQAVVQRRIQKTLDAGHAVYAFDDLENAPGRGAWSPYVRTLAWVGPRGPVWRLERRPGPAKVAQ